MSFCLISYAASRPAPRMPMPNRHVTGQGHHRAPQRQPHTPH